MREISLKIEWKETGNIFMNQVFIILVNLKIIKEMEKEFFILQMGILDIKEILLMIYLMEMEK